MSELEQARALICSHMHGPHLGTGARKRLCTRLEEHKPSIATSGIFDKHPGKN